MSLRLVTPPASGLVSLGIVKKQCRVDHSDDDTYLAELIDVASAHIDGAAGWLGRSIAEQEWELRLDRFPSGKIYLPLPPLIGVAAVEYIDRDGVLTELNDFRQFGIGGNGYILPAYNGVWPEARDEPEAARVRFTAGYEAVPKAVEHAVRLLVGDWYENRENAAEIKLTEMPTGVEALLMPLRHWPS